MTSMGLREMIEGEFAGSSLFLTEGTDLGLTKLRVYRNGKRGPALACTVIMYSFHLFIAKTTHGATKCKNCPYIVIMYPSYSIRRIFNKSKDCKRLSIQILIPPMLTFYQASLISHGSHSRIICELIYPYTIK